jgi:hypothetical protein
MICSLVLATTACGSSTPDTPPLATPAVRLNHERAPAGSPLEITYRFTVAPNAKADEDYRVMVHVVDADDELMWTDDHNPPVPTTAWKPGQVVEYTRTIFVPVFPYVGQATMQIGLHSTRDQRRVPLAGEDVGQRAYRVARFELLPQTENLFRVFKDGWHPAEVAADNASVEWQWTKKDAVLAFRNPNKDAVFYLELDSPGSEYHGDQQVRVSLGGQTLEQFSLPPNQNVLKKIALPAAAMGMGEMAEIQLSVDKTFVPASANVASKDPRELGVRVFHAYVDAR